ncbi:MAG: Hint domain-containing protein [Pseudomonadota bacterium]
MTWVGLADQGGAQFDLTGLSNRPRRRAERVVESAGALATRGTLMLEADVAQFTIPRLLIDHCLGASYGLVVAFGETDTLEFALSVGDADWVESLPLQITDELQTVRITYAWDAASRAAVLSIFQPRSQHLAQVILPSPRPIPLAALRSLIHEAPAMCRSGDIRFVALSRAFEPAGAMPGLARNTQIMTRDGLRFVSEIERGDMVIDVDGRLQRVQAAVRRVLPARGSFTPYRLRAPYLGLERDFVASGESLVELQGSDVEYLLGVERVLAHASQVAERDFAGEASEQTTVTYYQLLLERSVLMDASIGVLSLNLGAAVPTGIAAATTLWADAGSVLRGHDPRPYPVARSYEVVTLNASRAA